MSSQEVATRDAAEVAQREVLNERLRTMVENVPGQGDDAVLDILEQLLSAERLEDLDSPWNAEGLADHLDETIAVTAIKRVPSDIEDGPGFFLVVSGSNAATGEILTTTTSSVSVMVQLIHAYNLGWLPALFTVRKAERPTKRGFYPLHLEVYRGVTPPRPKADLAEAVRRINAERDARQAEQQRPEDAEHKPRFKTRADAAAADGPGF